MEKYSQGTVMREFCVPADSLADFLERYTQPRAHGDRGDEFVAARIESHQNCIDKYGYTFITRHDSKCGELVAYYPNDSPLGKLEYRPKNPLLDKAE